MSEMAAIGHLGQLIFFFFLSGVCLCEVICGRNQNGNHSIKGKNQNNIFEGMSLSEDTFYVSSWP